MRGHLPPRSTQAGGDGEVEALAKRLDIVLVRRQAEALGGRMPVPVRPITVSIHDQVLPGRDLEDFLEEALVAAFRHAKEEVASSRPAR